MFLETMAQDKLQEKNEIRIRFVAHKDRQVGQIYGVRLVKQ